MPVVTDQMGRAVEVPENPQRIVSLVPSQTELLADLGADQQVVGITKFCVHPENWFKNKTRIGGTKSVHLDKVRDLSPDLILANKEENKQEQIEALAKEFPVWISDIQTLDEAKDMIRTFGQFVDKQLEAAHILNQIDLGFSALTPLPRPPKTAYLIWNAPIMLAGKNTFINTMMEQCGFDNVATDPTDRYPEFSMPQLKELNPDLILLSSEPFPFKEKHQQIFSENFPDSKVLLVDGEMFSWYGSRLALAGNYFGEMLTDFVE